MLAHEIADRGQVLRQIDLHIAKRGADMLGLSHQRVALIAEILKEPANPHLVGARGSFKRCNFALHLRFQFAGARQRPSRRLVSDGRAR